MPGVRGWEWGTQTQPCRRGLYWAVDLQPDFAHLQLQQIMSLIKGYAGRTNAARWPMCTPAELHSMHQVSHGCGMTYKSCVRSCQLFSVKCTMLTWFSSGTQALAPSCVPPCAKHLVDISVQYQVHICRMAARASALPVTKVCHCKHLDVAKEGCISALCAVTV